MVAVVHQSSGFCTVTNVTRNTKVPPVAGGSCQPGHSARRAGQALVWGLSINNMQEPSACIQQSWQLVEGQNFMTRFWSKWWVGLYTAIGQQHQAVQIGLLLHVHVVQLVVKSAKACAD